MLGRSFRIESSSKMLITRTGIKARLSSILGRIRPLILELLALEWQKVYTFELEYHWSQLANLDQILCVASLGWGKGCIMFWGRLDQNSCFHGNRKPPLTYNGENDVSTFSQGERGGSVVECRTPEREVRGSRPTAAVLCPWARHFTPRKYWLITQEAMAPSRHDWKIVDWDVKPQRNQNPPFLGCFWSDPFEKTTFDLGTLDSGERSLPFGLLVQKILSSMI